MSARGPLYRSLAYPLHAGAKLAGVHRRGALRGIEVRRVALPTGLGVRVVLAADWHVDATFFPRARVREVVELINGIDDVDAVVMPGDFVGHDVRAIDWAAEEFAKLVAPTFATLGNHDHMEGAAHVTTALQSGGVDVLTNRAAQLPSTLVDDLWLIGLESCFVGRPVGDVAASLVPAGARGIVLGHEPVLATTHRQLVHLAGHTHHGQIRIPRVPLRLLPIGSRPFPEGLAEVVKGDERRYVYTTGGLGSTTLPVRIGVPPEIVVLDL